MTRKSLIVVIFILILLPLSTSARMGWWFTNYSLLYGGLYHLQGSYLQNIEFVYDQGTKTCTSRPSHFGFGANTSFNHNYAEFGLKAFYNPTRITFWISRMLHLSPYLYAQANYTFDNLVSDNRQYLGFRSGLGFLTIHGRKKVTFRISAQVGYNINPYVNEVAHGLSVELKVGIGLNIKRIRAAKKAAAEDL